MTDWKGLRLTTAQKQFLKAKHIQSLDALLHTYPLRYIQILPFTSWQPQHEVLFKGRIDKLGLSQRISKGRIATKIWVWAYEQEIEVTLFTYGYFPKFEIGRTLTVCGYFHPPRAVTASWTSLMELDDQKVLYPVYSIPNKTRRDMMIRLEEKALHKVDTLPDKVPLYLRERYHLYPLEKALKSIHQPKSQEDLYQGIRALKYEEFLTFHCARLLQSFHVAKKGRIFDQKLVDTFLEGFPYPFTSDQKKSLDEILADLRKDQAMYRLLQGDVGCGKTAVAAATIYAASLSHGQSALLAPTEILARQHLKNLQSFGIEASLLCGSLKASEKRQVLEGLQNGSIQVVVGTHALFQKDVIFDHLSLVIADEQHRFGVLQRRALIEKGYQCDVLLMSATPIPRTAAHFLYGDIDLSTIHTLPPGRQRVKTKYIQSDSMAPILPRILEAVENENRQVYVVCPAIEENEEEGIAAAKGIYEGMQQVLGQRLSIGLLHGKMKNIQKEEIMKAFESGEIQILVSTTVIEVGIDVANATIMVIYDAHRFGLSSLHQLRGRCARGKKQGECYLLSSTKNLDSITRLHKLEELDNGFDLATYDLQVRGPGDLLGTRQSGLPTFILGDATKDLAMMECCAKDAKEILNHPENPDHHPMLHALYNGLDHPAID